MQEIPKVAIIGGGASGIFCAICLLSFGIPVVLFEKNKTLGKKLLATGNGRCNIHNQHTSAKQYQTSSFSTQEIQSILENFNFQAFHKFCQKLGIALAIQEDGRVYPLSNSAKSVLEIFTNFLQNSKHFTIHLDAEIIDLHQTQGGFVLRNAQDERIYPYVILACGSEASLRLGGSDKGLKLARGLGLEIISTYPSLVPLNVESQWLSSLSGVKITANITLKQENQILKTILGDVLFTDYGISGFGVLDISPFVQFKQNFKIVLDFLPSLEERVLENQLANLMKAYPNRNLTALLSGFLHPKIAKAFAQNFSWNPKNTKQLKQLVYKLKNFELKNPTTRGFENAEVSGGGISGKEIKPKTMESKKCQNLYIIGEMLDIVGNRGGYNLAFAFASAWLCAGAIQNKLCNSKFL